MTTNLAVKLPANYSEIYQEKAEYITTTSLLTRRERNALKVIYSHAGKKLVYETYLKANPEMASKYLKFIARNPSAIYIKWDEKKQKFVA